MESLASELILQILENVYYAKDSTPDHMSLANCSLISRAWTAHAQKLLFRSLELISAPQADIFYSATANNAIRRHSLAEHVRILHVHVEVRNLSGAMSPQLFARVVTRCVRLYELRIQSLSIHSFDNDTLALLSQMPSIKALSIIKSGVQSIVLYQLASLLPTLRHLRLLSESSATPPSEPAKFSLYELICRRALPPDVMMWLLGASHSSLRILEMWDMCSRATMQKIMLTHGPHLRSLRVLRFDRQTASLVQQCPNLQELVLPHVPIAPMALGPLPSTMEHLSFRYPFHPQTASLADLAAAVGKELPKLRLITCEEKVIHHVEFEMLRAACVKCGIEVRSDGLPFQIFEDMVPVTRFPRPYSVSNFKLMN